MKRTFLKRMLSLLLTAAMLLTVLPSVALAAESEETNNVTFQEISQEEFGLDDLSLDSAKVEQEPEVELYSASAPVRVSIVLNAPSTVEAGFSTMGIAQNSQAQAYRNGLETAQQSAAQRISKNVLGGEALDVVWNLTLAANVISANVPYGKIDAIKAVPGVKDVVLETVYEPMVYSVGGNEPTMASAVDMTGANTAWESGYTGAGSRVAIIDTGLDTDHQSVNADAFLHAIEEDEETYGTTYDLMDEADIAEVLSQLNIYKALRM